MFNGNNISYKDTKGFWEYNDTQKPSKKTNKNEEQNIKLTMRPGTIFNPKMIDSYINPKPSKEELILERYLKKEKLNTTDKAIVENYIKKKDLRVKNDIAHVKEYKLNSTPETNEGRRLKMLLVLQHKLSKNLINDICMIYLRFKEDDFILNDEDKKEFATALTKMNNIVNTKDMIEYQFTVSYNQMPPLNSKGFTKFDAWQIEFVNNMKNLNSTLVCTPTSSGKSLIAAYLTEMIEEGYTTIILAPTSLLVWQTASLWGAILKDDIPIITDEYLSIPRRNELVELLNKSSFIVATPEALIDYLPLLSIKVNWIVYDEIHTIGIEEGCGMEQLLKIYDTVPFVGLSATIGELDSFKNWIEEINPERKVKTIVCNDRYFNFDMWSYNFNNNKLDMINPLAMVDIDDFKNGKILEKNLQPTPQNTWNLYLKVKEQYGNLNSLEHTSYFDKEERIHLNKSTKFFFDLIKYMIDNFDETKLKTILDNYKDIEIDSSGVNTNKISIFKNNPLIELTFLLKKEKKLPVLIFMENTEACLRTYRTYLKDLNSEENAKFPRLMAQRLKAYKKARRNDKHKDKEETLNATSNKSEQIYTHPGMKVSGSIQKALKSQTSKKKETSKKEMREMITSLNKSVGEDDDEDEITALQEPTMDFTLTEQQYFTEAQIIDIADKLKTYYPYTGEEYHYVIHGIWRGVGIIADGLPSNRFIQSLANEKKLGVVFTDKLMRFGISMPFPTVVIYKDPYTKDNLDSMSYHQMAGRAGRRGLETQANIIFVNYNMERIKELSICPIPKIIGKKTINICVPHASKLALMNNNNQNWDKIFKNPLKGNEEYNLELLEGIKSNYEHGWNFAMSDDKNHLHMMWKLRNCSDSNDPIRISFLISYLKRGFESMDPSIEKHQIMVAHFLSHFINIKETSLKENELPQFDMLINDNIFSNIFNLLRDLELDVPENIDGSVFQSIRNNTLYKSKESTKIVIRNNLNNFGKQIKIIQHFCFHSKLTNLARLLGKLCTRIFWINHCSSPIMKKINEFDNENDLIEENYENDVSEDYYQNNVDDSSEADSGEAEEEEEEDNKEDEDTREIQIE